MALLARCWATVALTLGVAGMFGAGSAVGAGAGAPPPFIPIGHTYLPLPATIQPWGATWTPDGQHVLFENQLDYSVWTIGADGSGLDCLSCRVANFPKIPGNAGEFTYAFPDDKRLFISQDTSTLAVDPPFGADAYVVECAPSIFDCASSDVLPVDMSADTRGAPLVLMRRTWHLAPDGVHLGWTDVRPDGLVMLVAQLQREGGEYVAADPRVIDPRAAGGPGDHNSDDRATTGEVFELKSFADGGRDALIVGQVGTLNPDQELVDLATGGVTRLTSGPDWDEDGSVSPDGAYLTDASGRTMHATDALGGMLPELRPFIELPVGAAVAGYYASNHDGFQCSISPWLLPASGDDGGTLLGQPLSTYAGGETFTSDELSGQQAWSPDGTRVLLQEEQYGPSTGTGQQAYMGTVPSRIAIATLGRAPAPPLPVVSSAVGAWAPTPSAYSPGAAASGIFVARGQASGSAIILHLGNLVSGVGLVIYEHYSEDGRSFADGTESVANPAETIAPVRWRANITISGAHHGYLHANMSWNGPQGTSGSVTSMLDGTTLTGPPPVGACPARLPAAVPLRLRVTPSQAGGRTTLTVTVSAAIAGAGMNEQGVDARPVQGAQISAAGAQAITDATGVGSLLLPAGTSPGAAGTVVSASAGDTFAATSVTVGG